MSSKYIMKPGYRLANGAVVALSRGFFDGKEATDWVVLAYRDDNSEHMPWITWRCGPEGNDTCWGHYFNNQDDAVSNYIARCDEMRSREHLFKKLAEV